MMAKRDKTTRLLGSMKPKKQPIADNFILPNNSGDHVRSIKRQAPIDDADLVNKKYVDDTAASFWQRVGTELSPKTAGDDIKTTGVFYADAIGTGLDVLHSATIGNHLNVGDNLTVEGYIETDIIKGKTTFLSVGGAGSNNRMGAPGTDDTIFAGRVEFNEEAFFELPVKTYSTWNVADGAKIICGSGNDINFGWDTNQTPDTFLFSLSAASRSFIVVQTGGIFDYAHALQDNPTLFIHSANQATDEWISMTHNQTNAIIGTGTGSVIIAGVDIADVATNTTAIALNTTHRTSTGADHIWLNQYVTSTSNPQFSNLTVNGVLRLSNILVGSSSDALDVRNNNIISCNTIKTNIVIGGFQSGIEGQILRIVKIAAANSVTLEHNEATGTQKIMCPGSVDFSITGFGGITLVFIGAFWYIIGSTKV